MVHKVQGVKKLGIPPPTYWTGIPVPTFDPITMEFEANIHRFWSTRDVYKIRQYELQTPIFMNKIRSITLPFTHHGRLQYNKSCRQKPHKKVWFFCNPLLGAIECWWRRLGRPARFGRSGTSAGTPPVTLWSQSS